MARSGGARGSYGGHSYRSSYTHSRTPPSPAVPAPPAPLPAPVEKRDNRSLLLLLYSRLWWRSGDMSLAQSAVDAVKHEMDTSAVGSSQNNHGGSDECALHNKAIQDCLSSYGSDNSKCYGSDNSKCQFYIDLLNGCRRMSGSALTALS